MELHTLKPALGYKKKGKRIGRGQGSGKGGTATKGHKGAQSRSGYKTRPHFEGGQMPLQRRIPKFGFKKRNKIVAKPINLHILVSLAEKANTIDLTPNLLVAHGLVKEKTHYKILASGELDRKLNVTAPCFSIKAKQLIEKQGGTVTVFPKK